MYAYSGIILVCAQIYFVKISIFYFFNNLV